MNIKISALLRRGALLLAPLALFYGCSSGDASQVQDGGGTSGDLAGADLANVGSGTPESDPKLQGITTLHNQVRAGVVPQPATPIPALTWDSKVAAAAQLVVDSCLFQHSGNGYGENIYAVAGSNPTPADVVNDWAAEKANYNYAKNTCASGKTCGHYTQVVWRSSLLLGCAQRTCTTNSPFSGFPTWQFWVCDYDPAGNDGQKPY